MYYEIDMYGWATGRSSETFHDRYITDIPPPESQGNMKPYWIGTNWELEDYSIFLEKNQIQQKMIRNQANIEARKLAYTSESDPLFFKSQRGEATEQEWKDKVAEIRSRYPIID